jgi:DNA-binding transcriptional ArsR family regulator
VDAPKEIQISQKQYDDLARFYDLLKSPEGIMEGFFIKPDGKKVTHYYGDKDKFIQEVAYLNSQGFTCYAGLQPRDPQLTSAGKAGRNEDIISLRFLYADLDPVRPDGVNATEEEKLLCHQSAKKIQEKITNGLGYQNPIIMDSGNGTWLLLPLPEIAITDENRREIAGRLKAWGANFREKFEAAGIKIDTNVYDLRRLTKIPGTRIFNHPDSPKRPQRISALISKSFSKSDQKLRDDFLNMPVEIEEIASGPVGLPKIPVNGDRIFERCYLMRFLRQKGEAGVNLPHGIRLALSSFSLALGDLDRDLAFIRQIIGGCPDFSEPRSRYYLQRNQGKVAPYGCGALRKVVVEHFKDFQADLCACNLTPSHDPGTGKLRKPSPIRFAHLLEEDLEDLFKNLHLGEDEFKNFLQLKKFTGNCLSAVDAGTAKKFLEARKKDLKLKNDDIGNLLAYRKQVIDLPKDGKQERQLSQEEVEKAIELLKSPSLLYDYGEFIGRLGMVGEKRNIRLVLLALTSRLLAENLISLAIKADSSAGKSWLLRMCLKVFPAEFFFEYTSMSDKALIYMDRDYRHKFIIFFEFTGQNDEINYLVRTLMSEGRLRYEYTAKVDGKYETVVIDKEGPTGFITTTTQPQIFDENETRIFSLFIDESEGQTQAIIDLIGDKYAQSNPKVPQSEIDQWTNIQRVLKPYPVIIPYSKWLAQHMPVKKVRIRRDFERILMAIEVCALLHQYQRRHVRKDGQEYLEASVVDYLMVKELLEGTLIETVEGTSPKTEMLVQMVREIYAGKGAAYTSEDETDAMVSMTELVNKAGKTRRTVERWLEPAVENGLLDKKKRGRQVFFKPAEEAASNPIFSKRSMLPAGEALINNFPELCKEIQFVHPISGEKIEIIDDGS